MSTAEFTGKFVGTSAIDLLLDGSSGVDASAWNPMIEIGSVWSRVKGVDESGGACKFDGKRYS